MPVTINIEAGLQYICFVIASTPVRLLSAGCIIQREQERWVAVLCFVVFVCLLAERFSSTMEDFFPLCPVFVCLESCTSEQKKGRSWRHFVFG